MNVDAGGDGGMGGASSEKEGGGTWMEFGKNPEESHRIQQQQRTSMNPKNPEGSLKYPIELTVT